MELLDKLFMLIKCLLYFILAIILMANLFEPTPLGIQGRVVLGLIAFLEGLAIVRKFDNRKKES